MNQSNAVTVEDEIRRVENEIRPGEILRTARERIGLSTFELAAQLKLSERVVVALESNDVDALPSPVFVKGYLGSFARFLNIDAAQLNNAFDALVGEEAHPQIATPEGFAKNHAHKRSDLMVRRWGTAVVLLVLVALSLVWWQGEVALSLWQADKSAQVPLAITSDGESQVAPAPEAPVEPSARPVPESIDSDRVVEEVAPVPPVTETVAPVSVGEESPAAPAEVVAERPADAELVAQPAISVRADATASSGSDRLDLVVSQDSWVEVRDAKGEVLIYQLVTAGSTPRAIGDAPFEVYLGFAEGVELQLNDQPVSKGRVYASGVSRFSTGPAAAAPAPSAEPQPAEGVAD